MIRVVWWEEWWLYRKDCYYWCQAATTAMWMVAATRSFTLHNDAGLNWFQIFSSYFGLWLCDDRESIACESTAMSQYIHCHWNSYFLLHFYPKTILSVSHLTVCITSLLQTSCSFFIDVASCYNHSRVFYACCTISMHITVILAVMIKSAILMPKNSMCPILPLKKNY